MEKISLTKFYEINAQYKELERKVREYYKELKELNARIDLNEIEDNCSYAEVKQIYDTIKYSTADKSVVEKVINIMNNKKETEYPEVLKVHYFPEILKFDFLKEEDKIKLDRYLREAYRFYSKRREIKNFNKKTIEALIEAKIIEKEYMLYCTCGSSECSPKIIKESRLKEYEEYWKKEKNGEISEEDDTEFNYGSIVIPCIEGEEEITNSKDFTKYKFKQVSYSFIKEPDLYLEEL